jgi:hypothetical protein
VQCRFKDEKKKSSLTDISVLCYLWLHGWQSVFCLSLFRKHFKFAKRRFQELRYTNDFFNAPKPSFRAFLIPSTANS